VIVLFRFIKCLLVSAFSPAIDPVGQATVRMRVWPNDLDLNFHATSGRYLTFMDVGRVALLVRMRLGRKVLARKWRPIVGGAMITYRKSLLPFETFVVRSRVLCWDEKWFYFEHIIEGRGGEVAATGTVRGLLRGPRGNVAPSELIALSGRAIEPPPIPDFIARWREAEKRA
jgi:acyl-CoA thioesterase FadM